MGWTRWNVLVMLTPTRCYKCQRLGHIAKECKNDYVKKEVP